MASVVDLFCGVGGLTHGFIRQGGFHVIAGIDADASCRYAYEHNNPGVKFYDWDLVSMAAGDVARLYAEDDIRVLVGCAPCQPFSRYSNPDRSMDKERERWNLLPRFAEIVAAVSPTVVSMENVPELMKHPAFDQFVRALRESGYKVSYARLHCYDYGVPQTRDRLVLLASKLGEIALPVPTHDKDNRVTVDDLIRDQPPIAAGETHPDDPVHRAQMLTPINLRRIQASVPGGTWRDWDEELRSDCHKKDSGQTFSSVYGRMRGDGLGPTITTECSSFGSGRFGHPRQDRAISLREAALLQTFPRDYAFYDTTQDVHVSNKQLARHIGNAVPVRLAESIADAVWRHLDEYGLVE